MTSSTGHFHGRHYRGYMRSVREIKRQEAEERQSKLDAEVARLMAAQRRLGIIK